jgi:hypothetical protein
MSLKKAQLEAQLKMKTEKHELVLQQEKQQLQHKTQQLQMNEKLMVMMEQMMKKNANE